MDAKASGQEMLGYVSWTCRNKWVGYKSYRDAARLQKRLHGMARARTPVDETDGVPRTVKNGGLLLRGGRVGRHGGGRGGGSKSRERCFVGCGALRLGWQQACSAARESVTRVFSNNKLPSEVLRDAKQTRKQGALHLPA